MDRRILDYTFNEILTNDDELTLILLDKLNNSFEDWINYCHSNSMMDKVEICNNMMRSDKYNKIWYDQLVKLDKNNANKKNNKYQSKTKYFPKFLKEWKKVRCFPVGRENKDCLDINAKRGSLSNVQFLIKKGVLPDKITLDNAAESGNMNLVVYLIEKLNLIPDENTLNISLTSNIELAEYLLDYVDI